MLFRMVYKSGQIFLSFCHNTRVWQTDRQTDRQNSHHIPRLHYMQRGKNALSVKSKMADGAQVQSNRINCDANIVRFRWNLLRGCKIGPRRYRNFWIGI